MKILKILPIIAIAFLAACKSTVPQTESLLEERVSPAGEICSSSVTVPKSKYANSKEKRLYEASNQIIKGVNDMPFRDDYAAPGASSCNAMLDGDNLQLHVVTAEKKGNFLMTISNGIASCQEEYMDHNEKQLAAICKETQRDTTKSNVKCADNIITYIFNKRFDDIDNNDLLDQINYSIKSDSTKSHVECSDNIITHSLNYDFNNIDIHYMNKELKMICDEFTSTAITPCNSNCKPQSNETPLPSLDDDL